MKITPKILSIPPFISTSWENVDSLAMETREENHLLVITLKNQKRVEIPNLDHETLEQIFETHINSMEMGVNAPSAAHNSDIENPQGPNPFNFGFPLLKIGVNGPDALGGMMQHNPSQADAPNLPDEILNKISSIIKALDIGDPDAFPKAEPHCNCPYCQIAKVLNGEPEEKKNQEEEISEEDLSFREWDIEETSDSQVFIVKNPFDKEEEYKVYLGDPIGCTCGNKSCEHIRVVLKS